MSIDATQSTVKKYLKDPRIRYFLSKKHTPLGHARNLAMTKTKGEYLCFLDCDDLWSSNKLLKQVERFKKSNKVGRR